MHSFCSLSRSEVISTFLPELFPIGMGDGQTVAVLMYWSKAHEFLCAYASSPWRSVWGVNQVLASARKCILEYKQEFWNLFFSLWIWAVAWVWGKSTDAVTGFYFRVPGCLDMSFPFSQCLFRIISVSSRGSAYCMLDIFLYATFIQSQPSFQSVSRSTWYNSSTLKTRCVSSWLFKWFIVEEQL